MKRLLAIVLLVAACGGSAAPTGIGLIGQSNAPARIDLATEEPLATKEPLATEAPLATDAPLVSDAPVVEPTPEPTDDATTPADLSVKVTKLTSSVARGGTASVTIKTTKGASCSIDVVYKSGPSTAAGLGDKTASSTGVVTWSWKIGSRTTRGTWPISITCDLGDREQGEGRRGERTARRGLCGDGAVGRCAAEHRP